MKQIKSFKKVQVIVRRYKKNMNSDSTADYDLYMRQIAEQYSDYRGYPQARNALDS